MVLDTKLVDLQAFTVGLQKIKVSVGPISANIEPELYKALREEGWTEEQFLERVQTFIRTQRYPNWTIAEFLDKEQGRAKIQFLTYKQVMESGNTRFIGLDGYRADDGTVMYCKHTPEAFSQYRRIMINGKHVSSATAQQKPEQKPEAISETSKLLGEMAILRAELAEERAEHAKTQRVNANLYKQLQYLEKQVEQLRKELNDWSNV